MADVQNAKNKKKRKLSRFDHVLVVLNAGFIIFAVLLVIYLFFIQIVDVKHYRARAKNQRVGVIFSMRGDIVDRNGLTLARDKIYYNVFAHKKLYENDPERVKKIAEKLSPVLEIPEDVLVKKLNNQGPLIPLKKNINKACAQKVKALELREISLDKKNVREYPQGTMAAQVLGYYNFDADIADGVEYTAKDKLEHVINKVKFEKTRDGNIIYDFMTDPVATTKNPKGESVTLTIDAAIQHICEKEIKKMVDEKDALRGTVIVMNPKNGEILALAAYPTYDPNNYRQASSLQMKNWPLTDVFPPGSTFKIITVASAMELGKINENSTVLDTGKMQLGNYVIKNYDYDIRPYPGEISLEYLFEHSSNIGSVQVAKKMTSYEFYEMLKKFGFGARTGIDLPGESAGLLPFWSSWDKGIHTTMSYGYGTSVSAIQMASAVSALANNGVRVTPHVIKYSPEEAVTKIKEVQVVSPQTAKSITNLLVKSVNNGKSVIKLDKYNVAAKTGTSRKTRENAAGYSSYMFTSTIGYFPAEDPQVLVYVMVDSAKNGAIWGNTVAGPVFKEVCLQVARILNLKQDKKGDKN